ncbi:MAG: hypothetical protein WCB10_07775 [Steroidobacteraceae bacterium]
MPPYDSNGIALERYQIAAFTPAFTKDRYESTAWTLNGQIGPLSAVYTGSFMIRHIEGQQDYSNYLRNSRTGSYYGCIGTGAAFFNEANFQDLLDQVKIHGAEEGQLLVAALDVVTEASVHGLAQAGIVGKGARQGSNGGYTGWAAGFCCDETGRIALGDRQVIKPLGADEHHLPGLSRHHASDSEQPDSGRSVHQGDQWPPVHKSVGPAR